MATRKKWTTSENSLLTNEYLSGSKIRNIAEKLERTIDGVSKQIERLGLTKMDRLPRYSQKITKNPVAKPLPEEYESWVPFSTVLSWLKKNDIVIKTYWHPKGNIYFYRKIRLTSGQVLMMCNQLRLSQSLPVFRAIGTTDC